MALQSTARNAPLVRRRARSPRMRAPARPTDVAARPGRRIHGPPAARGEALRGRSFREGATKKFPTRICVEIASQFQPVRLNTHTYWCETHTETCRSAFDARPGSLQVKPARNAPGAPW